MEEEGEGGKEWRRRVREGRSGGEGRGREGVEEEGEGGKEWRRREREGRSGGGG